MELTALREQVAAAKIAALDQAECGVLLCALRQVLDDRSAGDRVGDFPYARYNSRLRQHGPHRQAACCAAAPTADSQSNKSSACCA